jgi:threonine/homoserine/homoserine lactone efflux protein
MGQAIGQVLSFGVGVALSPLPIIAVVLMLATPKGRVNGLAFLAGWVLGIAVLGTIVLLVASGASASKRGAPATWGQHRQDRPRRPVVAACRERVARAAAR